MSESDENNGGLDGKSSVLAPLLSQVPRGVSKIFILTPEILKTLGLAGHLSIRQASRDEPKSINITTLNLQQSSEVAEHESSSTSVSPIPEATSSTNEVKKRKRTSISEKNPDETAETPKSSIENLTQQEERLIGINPKISNEPNNEKESICCTPKTKKIRSISSTVENQNAQSTNKQAENESKDESESVVFGVRSSKRVAKPTKFDDFVMTEIFPNKSRTSDSITDTPVFTKRQSRKSSGSPGKAETPNSGKKIVTDEIDRVKETILNKVATVKNQRSSTMRKSLSNDEICSTVSETKFSVDKSKAFRTYERRTSRDQNTSKLVPNDETISTKEAEPAGQKISGTVTSLADQKIFLPVHQGKINLSNVKIIKTYQKPKIKDRIAPESVNLGDKTESKRELKPATSVQEITENENISFTREICVNKSEKQINVKAVERYEKPKARENIAGEIVQSKEIEKSMEKDEPALSKGDGSEKQKIVSFTEIRTIEARESKCFEKSHEMESQTDSPKSPEKNEEFKTPEAKLTNMRLKGRIITISKSKLTKFLGPPSLSKPLPPIFRDTDDPSVVKSHLPRSPDKKGDAGFSKTILPSSQDKKEVGTLETDPTISREDKKEASISKPIPLKSPTERQAPGSNIITPISRDDNKKSSISKKISPGCLIENEVVSKPEATSSADETTTSCLKPDKSKFFIKKKIGAAKPNIPKSVNKKDVSPPEVLISADKKEIKISIPEVPKLSVKEVGAPIPEVPSRRVKKEYRTLVSEVPKSPDKKRTNASLPEVPMFPGIKETETFLPEVPTSPDKNEAIASILEVPIDFVQMEDTTSTTEVAISPAEKDVKTSIPEVPVSFVEKEVTTSAGEKEAATSILEAPIFSDTRAEDNIPNLVENDPINCTDILNIDSSAQIPSTSPTSSNVEDKIVLTNFSIPGDCIVEELDTENEILLEETPNEVSECREPRKRGKRRSRKTQISFKAPAEQKTSIEVENAVSTAASSFDTFVEDTCRMKKSTEKSEEATDAKDPDEIESEKHEILFKSPDEKGKDSIPNISNDADNSPDILGSDLSMEIPSTSSQNLAIEDEVALENFPTGEESVIEEMNVENCIPVQDSPQEVSAVRAPRKKGRPKKPRISIVPPEGQEKDQQAENGISTVANLFDTFLESNCQTKKSTEKNEDATDAKDPNKIESEKHEVSFKSPHEKDKDSIPNISDDANNSPDILGNDFSMEIPSMSSQNSVIREEIVLKNFPRGEESIIEVMEAENCIPVQDAPKKVSEVRVPRKKGRPRKLPITIESSKDQETDQQVENVISTAGNTVDTSVDGTCRPKKPVQMSKDEIDGKGLSEDSEGEFKNDEIVVKRSRGRPGGSIPRGKRGRGRGRGKTRQRVDFEYVPREKSSGKKQSNAAGSTEVDNSEEPDLNDSQSTDVECGKCKEKMTKNEWSVHNLSKHNDMGWRNGEDEPDFSDEKFLRSVLMAALKKKKKKNALTCETCGVGKRSANGFISHLQFCGKTEEERLALLVTCPICGNVMMPSSMEMHERFHRQMDAAMEEQKKDVPTSTGRGKRKAAEKAATKIAEFTDLVKEEVAPSKKRRRAEMMKLIEKPRYLKGTPNRWRGIWKSELNTKGAASCRQPGCKFIGDSVEALCNHNITCPCTPRQNFVCKICEFSSESEKQVIKHVKTKHDGDSTGQQEDSDFEGEDSSSSSDSGSDHSNDTPPKSSVSVQKPVHEKRQRPKTNVKFLDDLSHIDPKWHTSYSPAIHWTMEFECENYRLRLFKDLKPNVMNLLNDEDALGYLPELSCSMRTKETKKRTNDKPPEWVSWKRFEGRGAEGIPTFFTGGPIWALAWLPIPAPLYNHSVDQYVAVSTHPTMESVYIVGKAHVGKNLIQIWNLGHLEHNKTTDHVVPTLSYGVAHDKGTIWCMEWCPSGCYEHSSFLDEEETPEEKQGRKRMGLLAAACSDGCVHVFSLPFPDELNSTRSDQATKSSLPIYETKPVITLIASTAMYEKGEQNWQCTKLNWSKELGHDTIIAGFSNGYVAMWDLNSESPLFVTRRGETTLIDAFQHFYAHGHAVSFVQMVPYGGKRFFITSGYDRLSKVWDLEDTSYPLSTTKRGIALDGAWLNHWPAYLTAYDDVMVHGHTYLMSLRQPGHKIFPLLPSNSPTFSVDVSDYGNSIGHGTMAGEILVMFPHQLWNHRDMERDVPRKRWLASSSEIVDIAATGSGKEKIINSCLKRKVGKDYVYMPETYDDCKNRFGIIFRDHLNRSKHDGHRKQSRPPCSERLSAVQIEQYPFASANRISWNPNAWSYLWLCVGYQNGLVRFLNFNSVAVDRELCKVLPSHADSMLDASRRSLKHENDLVNYDSSHTSDT